MKLLNAIAALVVEVTVKRPSLATLDSAADARRALEATPATGWLVEFPNGTVFIDSEPLMRINLANGYKCTPLYAGEQL